MNNDDIDRKNEDHWVEKEEQDEDDDVIALPSDTLALLQSFLKEKQTAQEKFEQLKALAHDEADAAAAARRKELSMTDFGEDWQLSQFWYDEETAIALAKEAIKVTPPGGKIACVSAPSAYVQLLKLEDPTKNHTFYVLEFDRRFSVFGEDFVFFDFNNPTDLDEKSGSRPLHNSIDTIIADPPFLSPDCWNKTAQCVRWLAKGDTNLKSEDGSKGLKAMAQKGSRVIICTGQVMRKQIAEELGCLQTEFEPKHKGGLSNEFGCFTNYESESFPWLKS
ncbi:EEF1A lysine methyltransferase 1 [Blyttiomyces sp. JEL0837]|nr:EEF1A lysine methyltransferase 1 [Blyttiomyces sp. JEL0837]